MRTRATLLTAFRGMTAAGLLALPLLMPRLAHAEPGAASLLVTRDEYSRDCPDAEVFAARVASIVGREIIDTRPGALVETYIQVELTRGFDSYRATIHTSGARTGSRSISDIGPGCANLSEAVAVALAVLLDARLANSPAAEVAPAEPAAPLAPPPREQSLTPPPSTQLPVEARLEQRSLPAPSSELADSPRWGVEVLGGLSIAILEHASPLIEGAVRARPSERFVLALGGSYSFPDEMDAGDGAVEVRLLEAHLRGCVRALPPGSVMLNLCLQASGGSLRGAGLRFQSNDEKSLPWFALGAGVEVSGHLGGEVSWVARSLALVPLLHQGFSVERDAAQSEAFETPRAGAMLSWGLFLGS